MTEHDAFWSTVREAAARAEHERNLRGKTLGECAMCGGSRHAEPSYVDYDAHGSFHVPAVDCRACAGRGRIEVPCAPNIEVLAIEKEIATWQERLSKAKARIW